ncbi:MAG TPA: hypothetical protein VGB24_10560 [Longimicrobium sp.]|jgi:hypothetical protein|uniref:hypothetical protein n=1 Tax=Longimicrobium sp. TaxID=2029185 RepID=UPI002ED93655
MSDARWIRVAEIVGAVARQALADRGLSRIALLDDGNEQADLAARLLVHVLGESAVERVTVTAAEVEPLLPACQGVPRHRVEDELRRMRARLTDALAAHPASKTELMMGGALPPEPMLPLGDLWATDVLALGAAWSGTAELRSIADEAGGIATLDAALRRLVDRRDSIGWDDGLPPTVRERVRLAIGAGAAWRRDPFIVPKLGSRTLRTDLFE